MKKYWELFVVFMRIGGFTFGGGLAMLPMIQKEIVDNKHWASHQEVLDYFSIGQVTPGAIAVNTATFIGYKVAGVFGGVVATVGVIFPSIVIITLITAFLANFASLEIVEHAFNGIRAAVSVLIAIAVWQMAKTAIVDWLSLFLFIIVSFLMLFKVTNPVVLVLLSAVLGLIYQWNRIRRMKP